MANIKSSKKRIVQNAKRSELNKNRKSRIRSSIKKIDSATLDKKNKASFKQSSIILAELLSKGKIKSVVFLNYHPKLNQFLFWCQQLIAESLGKKKKGFFPVISNVPKDHHSLLQLYLDGPKDKIFYIFSSKENSGIHIRTKQISNNISYSTND